MPTVGPITDRMRPPVRSTGLVWDAEPTDRQHGQHVEYTLQPEGGGTRVRFDITLEPSAPVLEFLIKRGEKIVLDDATEGLRKRVLG